MPDIFPSIDQLGPPIGMGASGIPIDPTSLTTSQTIPSGFQGLLYGTFTIPSGKTLTISAGAFLAITNPIMAG